MQILVVFDSAILSVCKSQNREEYKHGNNKHHYSNEIFDHSEENNFDKEDINHSKNPRTDGNFSRKR